MHANVMGQHMIVLNSYEAAADLLHRKGVQYSGRAPFHFALEMAGYKIFTTLIVNAGELWKEQRALFAHHIGTQKVLARFLPAIDAHTRHFLCNIIGDPKPENLNGYIRL
jgi:cytochrome P450